MQISKPIIQPQLQSTVVPLTRPPSLTDRIRARIRWLFDIDDGAGGITCFLCVLAVFGTLFVRLVELDRSLDSQTLKCTAVDKTTLQMRCEFQ